MKTFAKLFAVISLITLIGFTISCNDNTDNTLPQLSGTVSITGNAQVGQTLTADTSLLGGSGTISYRWRLSDNTPIGSDNNTYLVQAADLGSKITVAVSRSGNVGTIKSTPTDVVTDGSTNVTFNSVTRNGSVTQTTTELTLTFSQPINDFSADDITIGHNITGQNVSKGTLGGSGPVYTLPISGFTSSGTLTVSVEKSGYNINGASKTVIIYYVSSGNQDVTFSSLTGNGGSTHTTTLLTLTFTQPINALSAGDITITHSVSGQNVNKGALAGSGPDYTLPISGFTSSGTLTVLVAKSGYIIDGASKTLDVYYYVPSGNIQWITEVTFNGSEQTQTVNLSNLDGRDIYLAKVNLSGSPVSAPGTGGVSSMMPDYQSETHSYSSGYEYRFKERRDVQEFNANPPPVTAASQDRLQNALFNAPSLGDTRTFWVDPNDIWVQKQATLRATGQYGNIWVINENFSTTTGSGNKITAAQAQSLADKFDIIYPAATNILGYEYGGGPGGNGGKDGDTKVQILVYDIGGNILGYFWSKDYYEQYQMDAIGLKTNLAEIFYINSYYLNIYPDTIYSTLAHEFQHMINFNRKTVVNGKSSPTWYNEMLSAMTEDVIADFLGIEPTSPEHIIGERMPTFLYWYDALGVTDWNSNETYSSVFAFGAYLLRNYGGAQLLQKILANNSVDISSITAALDQITPGMTFEKALARYGEALVFSGSAMPSGVLTFDKTVTNTINGFTYNVYGFDIWTMRSLNNSYGPYINSLNQRTMEGYSVALHSSPQWKNKTENYSITLQRPSSNSNIKFVLMIR